MVFFRLQFKKPTEFNKVFNTIDKKCLMSSKQALVCCVLYRQFPNFLKTVWMYKFANDKHNNFSDPMLQAITSPLVHYMLFRFFHLIVDHL